MDTIADIYLTAYKEGLKGVTIIEGSREGILQTEDENENSSDNGAEGLIKYW